MIGIKSLSFGEHTFHGWELIDDALRIQCQITSKALKVIQGANYGSVEGEGELCQRQEQKWSVLYEIFTLTVFFLVICVCFKDLWLETFNLPHFAPIWNQSRTLECNQKSFCSIYSNRSEFLISSANCLIKSTVILKGFVIDSSS